MIMVALINGPLIRNPSDTEMLVAGIASASLTSHPHAG